MKGERKVRTSEGVKKIKMGLYKAESRQLCGEGRQAGVRQRGGQADRQAGRQSCGEGR